MSKLNFESRLQESISSVYYEIPYVAYFIHKAQEAYDDDNDRAASDALEDAAALLIQAGKIWAADKVRFYKRFM